MNLIIHNFAISGIDDGNAPSTSSLFKLAPRTTDAFKTAEPRNCCGCDKVEIIMKKLLTKIN